MGVTLSSEECGEDTILLSVGILVTNASPRKEPRKTRTHRMGWDAGDFLSKTPAHFSRLLQPTRFPHRCGPLTVGFTALYLG